MELKCKLVLGFWPHSHNDGISISIRDRDSFLVPYIHLEQDELQELITELRKHIKDGAT